MTDKQKFALIQYMVKHDVRKMNYNANNSEPTVDINFYDSGRNWHEIAILPDGKLRTYQT